MRRPVLSLRIELEEPTSIEPARDLVNAATVILVSAPAAAAGWGLLAALEHVTTRALRVWSVMAAVVTVLSIGGPLTTPGITTAGTVVLSLLHLLVGVVVITMLRRRSPGTTAAE